ncbi:Sensor histidine kinase RcsC [Dyadobacter sp. CECT 9623]|uniref:histidine kinase n=1 Tax=Dyadobacter linearis TaxID=2823330 RepID=A0ABN7RBL4_9BACT|nr:ATP-binding protein [Dyadobacter sp. CECT 9623]CAG5072393.1 Sensor histidine kinase RcsC [Dyadobacter sp. CECT 9623]
MDQVAVTSLEFLVGGGEMGERIRRFPWDKSPLGPPEQWQQSLKTCIRIMLSSKQPIWIGWGEHLIKLYNDAYVDIVRGKHPGALGQPASVVWKDIWRDIEPMLSLAMTRDEGTYVESQLLIMERSGFPEETYYTFSYTPVLGEDGRPAGIICYNTADTDRIINERSLRTMQQLDSLAQRKTEQDVYAQAVKALGSNNRDFPFTVIYQVNSESNTAEITAMSGIGPENLTINAPVDLDNPREEAITVSEAVFGNKIVESIDPNRWHSLPKGHWDVVPRHFVDVPIKSANRKFPLAILTIGLNPYRNFDDAYRNFIQLVADQISLGVNNALAYEEERKRAKALEELDKAKTLFFTNISHEFRTPLMLMLSPLEELLSKPLIGLSTDEKHNLEVTHRNAIRLLKLVNTLLDFSRIESGRNMATYVLTDIATYTQNLAGNFRSVIEKADLYLHVNVQPISQPVYVDKQMWEKIVFNLLSNAFKYTLEGGIELSVEQIGNEVQLVVEDSGLGIPEHELPHMFERFHRVQNTTGRTYEGTGIGLSLVKELVQLHRGNINVQSEIGKGSRFTVTIPTGSAHLDPAQVFAAAPAFEEITSSFFVEEAATLLPSETPLANAAPLASAPDRTEYETILVVDDNTDMREHIQSLVGPWYKTIGAVNGIDALEMIQKHRPSLILSDIMMPEMDGIELLRHVKNTPESAQIPIILITARAGEESKIEGYEIGADDYLVKPFSSNELLARIKSQLKIAKTRRQFTEELENEVRKRTEELTKANKELESFNYVASHDLQEPLRKIQTFIHLIDKNKDNREAVEKYFQKINSSAQRMSELIQSVLTYSRLAQSGEGFSMVDLNKIVRDIQIDFELLIEEKGAEVICGDLPQIRANKFQINQLFSNLFSNALKFSQTNPRITITSQLVASYETKDPHLPVDGRTFVHLTFSDNGIGFEPEFNEKIFSLFQRLHGKHEYSGTGIGLSIVKKIVEQHDGYVSAESRPGEGATFHIWLPVV